jgi:hypothetical protein
MSWMDWDLNPNSSVTFLFSKSPDWLWGPSILLLSGVLSWRGKQSECEVNLNPVPMLRMSGTISALPICFYGVNRDTLTLTFYQKEKFDVKRIWIKLNGVPRYRSYSHLGCDTMKTGRSTNDYEEYTAYRFLRNNVTLLRGIPSQQTDTSVITIAWHIHGANH